MRRITGDQRQVEEQAAGARKALAPSWILLCPTTSASLARSTRRPASQIVCQNRRNERQDRQHQTEADVGDVDAASDDHDRDVHRRSNHAVDRGARDDRTGLGARQPHAHQRRRDDRTGAQDEAVHDPVSMPGT